MKLFSPNLPVKVFLVNLLAILPATYVATPRPALAFPCAKASTGTELAICANREVKQADDAMAKAYFTTRDNLAQRSVELLKTSQRNWLKYRNSYCQAEPGCLLDETKNRTVTLEKTSRYQPAMVPVFRWQQGGKNAYFIKFSGMKFAYVDTPGQAAGRSAFNRAVDRTIAEAPWGETTEDQTIGSWEYETNLNVSRLNGKMISASTTIYNFSGGAHPNSWLQSININLQTGRLLKTTDLFSQTAINTLISDCSDIIIEAKSERFGITIEEARADTEQSYRNAVKTHVLDMATWSFTDKGAVINFNPYAIGPYAAGLFTCEFSADYITKLAKNPGILER